MTFPNAHEGVKKIFKAQILMLVAAALLILVAVFGIIMLFAAQKGNNGLVAGLAIPVLLFSLAAAVIAIIGLIFYILGINRAKVDEPMFTKALICVLVSLACSIAVAFLSKAATVKNIVSIVKDIANLGATVFIIFGIQSLAKKLGREDIVSYGKTTLYILAGVYALSIIAYLLSAIFSKNSTVTYAAGIISLVASIVSIAQYVIYLIFLKKSENMLEA